MKKHIFLVIMILSLLALGACTETATEGTNSENVIVENEIDMNDKEKNMLNSDKQKSNEQEDNPYLGLRENVLKLKPSDIGITLDNNEQVYAAIVDMPVADGNTATLACIFDGTVSLYYSNGGGMLGLGQQHEEIRQAGVSFLYSSGQVLEYLDTVEEFDLPKEDIAFAYLVTGGGIYRAKIDMNNIDKCEKPIQFLDFLIQNTLSKIRENS